MFANVLLVEVEHARTADRTGADRLRTLQFLRRDFLALLKIEAKPPLLRFRILFQNKLALKGEAALAQKSRKRADAMIGKQLLDLKGLECTTDGCLGNEK